MSMNTKENWQWSRTTPYLKNANKDVGHVVKRCMRYFPNIWVSRKRNCICHLILNVFLLVCHAGRELCWLIALILCSECLSACLPCRAWVVLVDCSDFVFWMSFCLSAMQFVSCTSWLLWFCVLNVFLLVCHAGRELYWLIAVILCSQCLSACLLCRTWVVLVDCSDFVFWMSFCLSAMQFVSCCRYCDAYSHVIKVRIWDVPSSARYWFRLREERVSGRRLGKVDVWCREYVSKFL